eukprot:GHVH01011800.1.p1 GENE.GHVH01011800.1~~GHVH01011800.1.p1  ORF type:complete len:1461 (+),score=208.67 GHVH01011800.1:501-4385(+)
MTHDIVLPYLTVEQTLIYAADLRLSHLTREQRELRVQQVLCDLEIMDCKDVFVDVPGVKKGTSTGQSKRLAIGVELLDNPSVLMLDEPTSCLDAAMSFELILLLKRLSRKRHVNVIFVIHQPRTAIFDLFDQVTLMKNGSILYSGDQKALVETGSGFLTQLGYPIPKGYNPSDFCINLVSHCDYNECDVDPATIKVKEAGGEQIIVLTDLEIEILETKFWTSPEYGLQVLQDIHYCKELFGYTVKTSRNKVDQWVVFKALVARSWVSTIHNPLNTWLSLLLIMTQFLVLGGFGWNLVGKADKWRDTSQYYTDDDDQSPGLRIDWDAPALKTTVALIEASIYGVDLQNENWLQAMFENGVDEIDGTHPLLDAIGQVDWLVETINVSTERLRDLYHLNALGYPTPESYDVDAADKGEHSDNVSAYGGDDFNVKQWIKLFTGKIEKQEHKKNQIDMKKSLRALESVYTVLPDSVQRSLLSVLDNPLLIPVEDLQRLEHNLISLMQYLHYVISYVDFSKATQCIQYKYNTCIGRHHCVTGDNTAGDLPFTSRVPTWHDQFNAAPKLIENLPVLYDLIETVKDLLPLACIVMPAPLNIICKKNSDGVPYYRLIPSSIPVVESNFFYYECSKGCGEVYNMKSDNLSLFIGAHEANSPLMGKTTTIAPKCTNDMTGAPVHYMLPADLEEQWTITNYSEHIDNSFCFGVNNDGWQEINDNNTSGRGEAKCGCVGSSKGFGSKLKWTCPSFTTVDDKKVECTEPETTDSSNCWVVPKGKTHDAACYADCSSVEQYYDNKPLTSFTETRSCGRSDSRWQTVGNGADDELTEGDIWDVLSILTTARMPDPGFDLFVECLLGQALPVFYDAMVAFNIPPLFQSGDLSVPKDIIEGLLNKIDDLLATICINDTTCLDSIINIEELFDTVVTEWTGLHPDDAFGSSGIAILRSFDPENPNSSTQLWMDLPHQRFDENPRQSMLASLESPEEWLGMITPSSVAGLIENLGAISRLSSPRADNLKEVPRLSWYERAASLRRLSWFAETSSSSTSPMDFMFSAEPTGDVRDEAIDTTKTVVLALLSSLFTAIGIATGTFLFAGNLGFTNMASLIQFPQERFLLNRERQNGLYHTLSWFTAKQISDFMFQVAPTLIALVPYYFMAGYPAKAYNFFMTFLVVLSNLYIIIGVNYVISAACSRMELAVSLAPVYYVVQFVTVGFFIPYFQMDNWYAWFRHFSTFRYAFYGILSVNFNNGGFIGLIPDSFMQTITSTENTNPWYWIGMSVVLGLVMRLIAFVLLLTVHKRVGCEV